MKSSRRNFLKTAAAGAVSASTISAASYARVLGANDRIRMGIIGTGGMGGGHIHAFCGFHNDGSFPVDLVALADVCKTRLDGSLKVAREQQEGVQVDGYSDYADLLARKDIDCILTATPEHMHCQVILDSLEAGKDVYTEKPMTLNLEQAMRVYKAVKAHPERVFTVGTQKMALAKYREAKKLLADGVLGKLISSQTSYCRNTPDGEWNYYGIDEAVIPGETLDWKAWLGEMPEIDFDTKIYHRWRRYKAYSTGIIGDLLVHEVTPLIFAMDNPWPIQVSAIGGHYIDHDMENFDQVNLTLKFDNDHTMIIAGATNNEQGLETLIRGQEGTMYLAGNNCRVRPERPFADDREEINIECEFVHDHNTLRLNWLECVRDRKTPFSTIETGMRVMVMVDIATRAMWGGKTYTWDPIKMEVKAG
jgi:predicted dehydrogenase